MERSRCATENTQEVHSSHVGNGFSGKNKPTQWSSTKTVFKATDFLPCSCSKDSNTEIVYERECVQEEIMKLIQG